MCGGTWPSAPHNRQLLSSLSTNSSSPYSVPDSHTVKCFPYETSNGRSRRSRILLYACISSVQPSCKRCYSSRCARCAIFVSSAGRNPIIGATPSHACHFPKPKPVRGGTRSWPLSLLQPMAWAPVGCTGCEGRPVRRSQSGKPCRSG